MHVDKVAVDDSSIFLDGETPEDVETREPIEGTLRGDVPASHIAHGELLDDEDANNDVVEYEYVELSEVTGGFFGKAKDVFKEFFVPIMCGVIALVCVLILTIGKHINSVLIAVGFVFIVVMFAIVIYAAWRDRKETREKYEYAKKVHEQVRSKMVELDDEEDDDEE